MLVLFRIFRKWSDRKCCYDAQCFRILSHRHSSIRCIHGVQQRAFPHRQHLLNAAQAGHFPLSHGQHAAGCAKLASGRRKLHAGPETQHGAKLGSLGCFFIYLVGRYFAAAHCTAQPETVTICAGFVPERKQLASRFPGRPSAKFTAAWPGQPRHRLCWGSARLPVRYLICKKTNSNRVLTISLFQGLSSRDYSTRPTLKRRWFSTKFCPRPTCSP